MRIFGAAVHLGLLAVVAAICAVVCLFARSLDWFGGRVKGMRSRLPRHRAVRIKGALLVSTRLSWRSYLVRLYPEAAQDYDRMLVVTVRNWGRTLFLSGWIAPKNQPPLTVSQWKDAKTALFCRATAVEFERRRPNGDRRIVRIAVPAG